MNRGQLRTLVLSWLDDPDGTYFTPAQVNVWLNNNQHEVQKKLLEAGENYYVTRMSGLLIANQDTYALPTDFKTCHKIQCVGLGTSGVSEVRYPVDWVTYQQLDSIAGLQTGMPLVYNIRRNIITFRPIPDNAYTVYLHQTYRVADMVNDTDLPDVPSDYTEYIAILTALDGFTKDSRTPSDFVVTKQKDYERRLEKDTKRDVSAPRMVVVTDDGGGGMLF